MKRASILLVIPIGCLLTLPATLIACSHEWYSRIEIENELGSYSFEYPKNYRQEIRDNLEYNPPYAYLILVGPTMVEKAEVMDPGTGRIKTVTGKRVASSITVTISKYKNYFGETYSAVDRIESLLEDEAKWEHFKLIERSPLTISGSQGELVVYLVDKLMPIPREDGKNLEYVRAVFFDYNKLTWEIEAKCNEDIQERVKADFDHIIDTFKILK